jgi:hypothetical protein
MRDGPLEWALLLLFFVVWIGGTIMLGRRAARYLRDRWPDHWHALDKPYVLHGKHDWAAAFEARGLRDPELTKCLRARELFDAAGGIMLVATAIAYDLVQR